MDQKLQGKTALVTGAGGGIGSAIVRLLIQQGCQVMVNDISRKSADALVQEFDPMNLSVISHVADISNEEAVVKMMQHAHESFGHLDILVNNAFAAFNDTTITDLREQDWIRTLDVCLKGPFLCTKHALPMMKEQQDGSIISISSVNAVRAVSETAYTAAKGGLISMMRLVASEYAEWNIRSNIICPGTIATNASMGYWKQFPTGYEKLLSLYPLGRIGTPEDVANYVLFLASDESRWITGTVQNVDGGLMAGNKLGVE